MTRAIVIEVTKSPAPNKLPIAKSISPLSLEPPAIAAVNTSGAPFPSATKVIPANV